MATPKTKTAAPRYDGKDSQNWVVKGSTPDKKGIVVDDTFTEYKNASAAARRYTAETGLFAQPVRA
jgi:hypothetical protein